MLNCQNPFPRPEHSMPYRMKPPTHNKLLWHRLPFDIARAIFTTSSLQISSKYSRFIPYEGLICPYGSICCNFARNTWAHTCKFTCKWHTFSDQRWDKSGSRYVHGSPSRYKLLYLNAWYLYNGIPHMEQFFLVQTMLKRWGSTVKVY